MNILLIKKKVYIVVPVYIAHSGGGRVVGGSSTTRYMGMGQLGRRHEAACTGIPSFRVATCRRHHLAAGCTCRSHPCGRSLTNILRRRLLSANWLLAAPGEVSLRTSANVMQKVWSDVYKLAVYTIFKTDKFFRLTQERCSSEPRNGSAESRNYF